MTNTPPADLSFLLSREQPPRGAAPAQGEGVTLGPLPWPLGDDAPVLPAIAPMADMPSMPAGIGAADGLPGPVVPDDASDPMNDLVAQMRNYQAELEIQNQVLDYSRAVAESASERFEALFANVPLPLLVLDGHDMVIQANAMAYRAFQRPGQERMLVSFMPFVREADCPRVRRAFDDARERGRSEVNEVVFNLGNATQMQGDLHIACIEIPQRDGPPLTQFMCAVVDQGPLLNERRTLQERNAQLHASERRLKSVINSSQDAIICVDRHQRITVFNPTATALFQCHITSALGSRLERFLPDAVQSLALAPLATQVMLGEMTARTATGKTLQVEVSMSFERMTDGEIVTIFARDLTAQQREEAQRNELETQLRESHKMQALGTLAGGIAHDFNNIVGAILGNVALAQADCAAAGAGAAHALESLAEIEKAARRARDLVRQILTFSRNQPPVRRHVQTAEIIGETEKLLRMSLPPAIELLTEAPSDLPLLADVAQVEQALFNLANNAVHAITGVDERHAPGVAQALPPALVSPPRGCIRIRAQWCEPAPRLCERLGLAPGAYVGISVQDDGPGMSADIVQRIFEPFFTTKPVGQGTGLGLAVVHGVMRNHGGAVDVSSQPGQGSCFTLYFPPPAVDAGSCAVALGQESSTAPVTAAAPPQAALAAPVDAPLGAFVPAEPVTAPLTTAPIPASAPAPAATPAMPATPDWPSPGADSGGPVPVLAATAPAVPAGAAGSAASPPKGHVLYVDDDQALVFLVQRLLRRRGYQVSSYLDPREAVAALERGERFDLLVTDYNMPGYSGVDLVRAAHAIAPALPVALASGYITPDIETAALAAGARALIHKPNDISEFCAVVDELARQSRAPSTDATATD